jgi:nucleoside-diphosphate-sugar epimerase
MTKVLVTGAAGYIGSHVVAALERAGADVAGCDVAPAEGVERLDLADAAAVEALVARDRPEVIVQLAYTLAKDCVTDAHRALTVNGLGVDRVFELARRHGAERVVYASSNAVYGDQSDYGDADVTEADHGRPRSLYGWMKQLNEAMAAHYDGLGTTRFVGVRVGSAFGNGRRGGTFNPIADVARQAGGSEEIRIPYPAAHAACFLHVEDVATAFAALALAPRVGHAMYNTGGEHLPMGRIARVAADLLGRDVVCDEPGVPMTHVSRVSWARLREEHPELAGRAPVDEAVREALAELLEDARAGV